MIVDLLWIGYLNKNERIYDYKTCQKIIEDFKHKKDSHGVVYGGFYQEGRVINHEINLKYVSHVVEDIFIDGNILRAKIKMLETPMGIVLKNVVDDCVFCTQCTGYVDTDNYVSINNFISVYAVDSSLDVYRPLRIRRKKLERILK